MFDNEIHLSFMSKSQNEGFARMVASSFVSQLDPTIEELSDIRTAVSEAVTNAVIHGYDNKNGTIYMDCYCEGKTVTITIRDDGNGIDDVELAMQPFYTSKPNLDRSGMGFSVMEAFMDKISVESEPNVGTTVTMVKTIDSSGAYVKEKQDE